MTNRQVRFAAENIEHKIEADEYSDEASGGDDGESGGAKKRQFNKFELLDLVEGDGEVDANSDDEDDDVDNGNSSDIDQVGGSCGSSSSKSKGGATQKHSIAGPDNNNAKPTGKRKPRKKRSKGKAVNKGSKSTNGAEEDLDDDDELDNLAKAISQTSATAEGRDQAENSRYKLLKVDMRNLVPETEIKRIFGKGVVKEDKTRLKHHPGFQRSRLMSGYIDLKATGAFPGPRMELDDAINNLRVGYTTGGARVGPDATLFGSSEPIYFKFVHDAAYQDVHRVFLDAVNRGLSEFIVQNMQAFPTHTESLIQLSHMLRVNEDYKSASEFIERALVVFEKGFHPRFNLATATCRLSYKRPENRTFFITIFKHISACHRRGLRRTPFEYSKLLLSLEPDNDPLMAVQLVDFYAIRSEEYEYLIDFYAQWEQLQKLPNLSFSLAMAHFLKSRNSKRSRTENDASLRQADECLRRALLLFPNFIIPLLDACQGEPDSELKKCTYFDYSVYGTRYKDVPETVDVLVALYVKRTYSLWKQKHVLAWLERNIAHMVAQFARGELLDEGKHLQHWATFTRVAPKNLLRHIVLCDLDMKVPQSASSSTYIDLDPYPPTDSIVSYDTPLNATGRGATNSSGAGGGGSGSLFDGISSLFFRSILPSFSLAEQSPALPAPSAPTTSRQRNRPPQRPAGSAAREQAAAAAAAASMDLPDVMNRVAVNVDGLDLDYDSIEYSLLIDALRDLPPLGPNSSQETGAHRDSREENAAGDSQPSRPPASSNQDDTSELRRRQTRPS